MLRPTPATYPPLQCTTRQSLRHPLLKYTLGVALPPATLLRILFLCHGDGLDQRVHLHHVCDEPPAPGVGVGEGPGQALGSSKPLLSWIFGVNKHTSQTCSSSNKTTVFAVFYTLRSMSNTATKRVFGVACKAFLDTVQ